jgi:predicted enzyme related to lactoylglutathione lyase
VGERSEYAPGIFCWVELTTPDEASAKAFYGELLGWAWQDDPLPGGGTYTMLTKDGKRVAGLHQPAPERAGPPAWLSYVSVAEADAAAARAAELGAGVLAGPFDVMEAGRMAVIQDPQGAVFGIWQPRAHHGAQLVNDPGALSLNQLNTGDLDAAREFYKALFGWRIEVAVEDPPYWGIYNGESLNGGLMPLPPDASAPSHWLAYFTIADLDAAATGIPARGGQVLVPPMVVPSGRILVATDPQGAAFALFEGEVDS